MGINKKDLENNENLDNKNSNLENNIFFSEINKENNKEKSNNLNLGKSIDKMLSSKDFKIIYIFIAIFILTLTLFNTLTIFKIKTNIGNNSLGIAEYIEQKYNNINKEYNKNYNLINKEVENIKNSINDIQMDIDKENYKKIDELLSNDKYKNYILQELKYLDSGNTKN